MPKPGWTMDFYTHRPRGLDEVFPWDHIDVAVKKKFLIEDYLMSQHGETRHDCRDGCFACGILPKFSQAAHGDARRGVGVPAGGTETSAGQKGGGMIPLKPV